ncbi:hypothetical protein [Streptomyces marincola]|uniref:Transmembrane protein n=1 Tax=Streptomyces marincola TaxID=2878388 RepID=A0A1W7CY20_9ACTN|nr:hypothetical protein [Streptomyces marincola]ARQ69704.1 hypothetical protein CAG99_13260 [Streptomyces marincola]
MSSPDALPPEDRAAFEQVLDAALRSARSAGRVDAAGAEALRALAVDALPRLAATAAPEHERLVRLRARRPAGEPARPPGSAPGAGTGVTALVLALVPALAAVAALVFLLLGHVLALGDPEPAVAAPMRTAGWTFAAVAALGLLGAVCGLVVAAARNGAASGQDTAAPRDQLARAGAEWRRALLDRGIAPFLREHAPAPGERPPGGTRPRFSPPDFSSPDFSRRAEAPAPRPGGARFSSPRFSSPDFSSPAEGGADRD